MLHVEEENYPAAREAYDAAIELAPESLPLRYWYGGFLLRMGDDTKSAIEQFEQGLRIDPSCRELQFETARAFLYQHEFDKSHSILEMLKERQDELSDKLKQKMYDLYVQLFYRKADDLSRGMDYEGSIREFVAMRQFVDLIPAEFRDSGVETRLRKAKATADQNMRRARTQEARQAAEEIYDWLMAQIESTGATVENYQVGHIDNISAEAQETRANGIVARCLPQGFGFISLDDGSDLFFHMSEVNEREGKKINEGTRVSFEIGENGKGKCARNVTVI